MQPRTSCRNCAARRPGVRQGDLPGRLVQPGLQAGLAVHLTHAGAQGLVLAEQEALRQVHGKELGPHQGLSAAGGLGQFALAAPGDEAGGAQLLGGIRRQAQALGQAGQGLHIALPVHGDQQGAQGRREAAPLVLQDMAGDRGFLGFEQHLHRRILLTQGCTRVTSLPPRCAAPPAAHN